MWGLLRLLARIILWPCAIVFIIGSLALIPGPSSRSPDVAFKYSSATDALLCPPSAQARISPASRNEVTVRLNVLQTLWNQQGPPLLQAASHIVKKPFAFEQAKVSVHLCDSLPGWSFPLMIPVNHFLEADGPGRWADGEFVDAAFHELLHLQVLRWLHWRISTPVLKQFESEALATRAHLHLYALQKAVYLSLGKENAWARVNWRSHQLPPSYARAVTLVEKYGYEPFVAELR